MTPAETITLPLADVRALVALAWEQTRHIEATDKSATGSIYGIEYADKTIARVASVMPPQEASTPRTDAADKRLTSLAWHDSYAGMAEHARQMERELAPSPDQIRDWLNQRACCDGTECGCRGVTRLQQLIYEETGENRAELNDDKLRMDWLDSKKSFQPGNCDRDSRSFWHMLVPTGADYYAGGENKTLREAIDRARGVKA